MNVWSKRRAQFCTATVASQVNPSDFDDAEVFHYSIPAIQETGGPVLERASLIESNKLLLRGGEVIVSRLNPHKNCVTRVSQHDHPILCSTEFVAFTPTGIDARFLEYCFRSSFASQFLTARAASATRSHSRVDPSEIVKFKIDQPDIETQKLVANYLDAETKQIDELVSEKQIMLSLLDEKRMAVACVAVTRGINARAHMKDSGHAWLGQIPAHWNVKRTKRVFSERDDRSETGEEELLTVSHITGVTKRSEKDVNMFEAETTEGYKRCSPGNLVINTLWAWMGAMGIAADEGIVSPAYHVYTLSDEILPGYVDAMVRTPAFTKEVTRFSTGVWSSRLRLYPEGLFEVRIPVPPLDEQKAIVVAIRKERARASEFETALRHSIALLKERRAALITAAVTGALPIPA